MSRGQQKLDVFPAENAAATFGNFRVETKEQEALMTQASKILSAVSTNAPRTITFIAGTPGCGKTYTAAALSRAVQDMGHDTALLLQGGASQPGALFSEKKVKLVVIDDLALPKEGESYFTVAPNPNTGKKSLQLFSGLQKLLDFASDADLAQRNIHLVLTSNIETNPQEIFNPQRIAADIRKMKIDGVQKDQLTQLNTLQALMTTQSIDFLFVQGASMRHGLADYVKQQTVGSVNPNDVLTSQNTPSGILVMSESEYNLLNCQTSIRKLNKADSYGTVYDPNQKLWCVKANTKTPQDLALIIRGIWETGGKMVVVCTPPDTAESFTRNMQSVFQKQGESHASLHQGKEAGFLARFNAMTICTSDSHFSPPDHWTHSIASVSTLQKKQEVVVGASAQPAGIFGTVTTQTVAMEPNAGEKLTLKTARDLGKDYGQSGVQFPENMVTAAQVLQNAIMVEIKKEGDKHYFVVYPSPDEAGRTFYHIVYNHFSPICGNPARSEEVLNRNIKELKVPKSASYLLPTDPVAVDRLFDALQHAIAIAKAGDPPYCLCSNAVEKRRIQHRDVALQLFQAYADSIKSTTASVKTVASSSETTATIFAEKTSGAATAPTTTPLTTASMFATSAPTAHQPSEFVLRNEKKEIFATVTKIERDDETQCYVIHGTNSEALGKQPKQVQIYDDGRLAFKHAGDFDIGGQMYANREAIFKHFGFELPASHQLALPAPKH